MIYSFGFTLAVGVLLNLFFGVLCTRLMLTSLSKFRIMRNPKLYGVVKMRKFNIDFVGKRKVFFTISIVLIAVSILSTFIFGVKLDIQFKGGTLITYLYDGDIDTAEFEKTAEDALGGLAVNVTTGKDFSTGKNNIQISLVSNTGLTSDKQYELSNVIQEKYAANSIELVESTDISPSSGKEFFRMFVAVAFASILLVIYIYR
jgi:preprotein translocase subunit SecF